MRSVHNRETGVFAAIFAIVFAAVLAHLIGLVPGQFASQLLTPNWMPQQIVKLIETSNDVQVALVADSLPGEHPDIALVLINEETLSDLPYVSPIDRGLMARIVTAIAAFSPQLIAVDLLFDRGSEPAKDQALLATLQEARVPIVLGAADGRYVMSAQARRWQSDFLQSAGRPVGFLNLQYDAQEASGDPIIRYRALAHVDGPYRLSFAEAIASQVGRDVGNVPKRISWLAEPAEGETFLEVDAAAVLQAADDPSGLLGIILGEQFNGRIVLVGGDFPGKDRHPTPVTLHGDGGDMLGLKVHAHALAALLDGRQLRDLDANITKTAAFVLALFGFLSGVLLQGRAKVLAWVLALLSAATIGSGLAALWAWREVVPLALFVSLLLGSAIVARLLVRFVPAFRFQ